MVDIDRSTARQITWSAGWEWRQQGRVGDIDADEHIRIVMHRGDDGACSGNGEEVVGEGIGADDRCLCPERGEGRGQCRGGTDAIAVRIAVDQDMDVPATAQPTRYRVEC